MVGARSGEGAALAYLMPSAEGRARRAVEAALAGADGPDTAQGVTPGAMTCVFVRSGRRG